MLDSRIGHDIPPDLFHRVSMRLASGTLSFMIVTAGALRVHLDYSSWASGRLIEAAARLTPEQLMREFDTADHNVLGTLVHIFAADRLWLGRIQGNPPARFIDPETDMLLSVLENDWPALHERWRQWAAAMDEGAVEMPIAYVDLKGNPYETPLWQIVLHVVNHATHHRGQVSGFLRVMGVKPPPLDLIAYYRQL